MADQNTQFGVNPFAGQTGGAGSVPSTGFGTGASVSPAGSSIPVPPPSFASTPMPPIVPPAPAVNVPPAQMGGVPQMAMPQPPIPQFPQAMASQNPIPQFPQMGGLPPMLKPMSPQPPMPSQPPMPTQPPKPIAAPAPKPAPAKALSLEELAKQSPIFSDSELDEDDFDPWAPLDDVIPSAPQEAEIVAKVPAKPVAPAPVKASPVVPPAPPAPSAPRVPSPTPAVSGEVVEGVLTEPSIEEDEGELIVDETDEDLDTSSFAGFLQDLNIDWHKILGCFGAFLLVIAVIFGGIFAGKKVMNYIESRPVQIEKEEPQVEEEIDEDEKPTSDTSEEKNTQWVDVSLEAGRFVGYESLQQSGESLSESKKITKSPEDIDFYLTLLTDIEKVYETDLRSMMNASRNRENTYRTYLQKMKNLSQQAHGLMPELLARQTLLETVFTDLARRKDAVEETYFNAVEEKKGSLAGSSLREFIELAQESVDIRARFRALESVNNRMTKYTTALDTRIRTVELNREALIKGVRVIEVENADLGLIVNEADL